MTHLNWTKYHSNQLPPMTAELVMDKDPPIYKVGENITGKLEINCSKATYIYGILVGVEGNMVVKLDDGTSNTQKIVEELVYVYGKGERLPGPAGPKSLPFSIKLSPSSKGELPGSRKTSSGVVLYQVLAHVKHDMRNYKQAEKVITILPYLNLRGTGVDLGAPMSIGRMDCSGSSSLLGFMGIGCKPTLPKLKAVLRLPQGAGYIPGESVPLELEVKNPYPDMVPQKAIATLVQKVVHSSDSSASQKTTTTDLGSTETTDLSGEHVMWKGTLGIPEGSQTWPSQHGIIEITHSIKVKIVVQKQDAVMLDAPIRIGTTR